MLKVFLRLVADATLVAGVLFASAGTVAWWRASVLVAVLLAARTVGAAAAYPATVRLEYTAVDLVPGGAKAFEAALSAARSALTSETLWYRMVAGGPTPRYVRLRPHPGLGAILDARTGQALPDGVSSLIAKTTIEVWTLRPTMSLGLAPPIRP